MIAPGKIALLSVATAVTITGSCAVTLGAVTSSASGTAGSTGTSATTLAAVTSTASGTHTPPGTVTGSSATTLDAVTSSGSGTHTGGTITGTAATTLAAVTSTASGLGGLVVVSFGPLITFRSPAAVYYSEPDIIPFREPRTVQT